MGVQRPRVLVLVKGLGIGGAERLIVSASDHWDRERFDYHVAYLLPWKDQLVGELRDKGVQVTCLESSGRFPFPTMRLRRLIGSTATSLVHAHLPVAGILARVASGVPVIYTEHNLVDSYRWPTRLANRITYRRNAGITAVSFAVAESARRYPGSRPLVVENGVDVKPPTASNPELRDKLDLPCDQKLVAHVGNIRPHKGHGNLLEAARLIASERDDILILSIGGEKWPGDLDRLRGQVKDLGLEGVIRFLGRREDALDFVATADLYVNPADVEGLPVSILEALALGKPVVATRVGGVDALLQDGVTGYLVEPGDPKALARAVIDSLDSPDQMSALGERGRALVVERYGVERMVRQFEDLYLSVLQRSR